MHCVCCWLLQASKSFFFIFLLTLDYKVIPQLTSMQKIQLKGYSKERLLHPSTCLQLQLSQSLVKSLWNHGKDFDHEQSGRYTRNLIPVVKSKLLHPVQRDIGISYCRLLLHDSMLKDDSYRSRTSVSPMCDCSSEKETAEHFLLQYVCSFQRRYDPPVITTMY